MTAEPTSTEGANPDMDDNWKGPFHLEIHAWLENQQTTHGACVHYITTLTTAQYRTGQYEQFMIRQERIDFY